jgi:hypothetical protein
MYGPETKTEMEVKMRQMEYSIYSITQIRLLIIVSMAENWNFPSKYLWKSRI